MGITINININGYGVSQTTDPSPDPSRTYTLLPGFSPVREMFGERKIKAKKKKKCTKGQVCGFSCVSKTKVCKANMTTAELKAHNAAKRAERREKAKAAKGGGGGAIEAKGGALALLDKSKAEETIKQPRFAGDRQSDIDAKYAKLDPTDKDIDNWFRETVDNIGTKDGIETLVAQELLFSRFGMEAAAVPYLDKLQGEKSFTEAYASLIVANYAQKKTVIDGKTYTATDREYWQRQMQPFPEEIQKFERAQKILSNPKKSEKQKEKAQKEIDKYERKRKELDDLVEVHLEKATRFANGDREFAIAVGKELWDSKAPAERKTTESFIKDFSSKSPSKREDAKAFILEKVRLMTSPDYFLDPMNKEFGEQYSRDGARIRLMGRADSPLKSAKTKAELKKAFRAFAVENHPDKGGDTKRFQAVSEQYQHMLTYLN